MTNAHDVGRFPYRRGISTEPYERAPWIIGQYSGYSGPSETNQRFKRMIAAGQQGLAIALDLPTQHGLDPDDALARGEVGRVGVSLATVDDFANLFDGIPLGSVRQISTTANAISAMFTAMVIALAERRGEDPSSFSIRLQNDVLKEYVSRGTQIFPVGEGARLSVDVVEYCADHFPSWVPMCVSGYHIRDAGATREQEVGFTLANARQYLDLAVGRGIDITHFVRSVSWFMSASMEFLAEAAKFRASRELWATTLRDEYGITDAEVQKLRIFAYTLGGEMSPFEISNNGPRITLSALGAVLGGVQALFCSSIDEAVGLPTDDSARLSVRTQQVILHEAGIASYLDPLHGSEVVERLTDEIVAAARKIADQIHSSGGSAEAIQSGWMRAQIDDAAWQAEQALRTRARVGEPDVTDPARLAMPPAGDVFTLPAEVEDARVQEIREWKAARNSGAVQRATTRLEEALSRGGNVVPALLDAFQADLTIGEVTRALIDRLGAWNEWRARRTHDVVR